MHNSHERSGFRKQTVSDYRSLIEHVARNEYLKLGLQDVSRNISMVQVVVVAAYTVKLLLNTLAPQEINANMLSLRMRQVIRWQFRSTRKASAAF